MDERNSVFVPGADFLDQAGDLAKEQISQLSVTAQEIAADATTKAQAALDQQRTLGADYVASLAGAVNRAASEFEDPMPFAAKYIREAAEQIDSMAGIVRDRNLKELVGEAQDFARRQPALFFGGAMLLGFAALRFLRSAPDSNTSEHATSIPSMERSSLGQEGS